MQNDFLKLLIKSAKQGKKNSFRELCNLNVKKIYNIAVRFVLNEKIAEIVTQNIFIEAWENLKFLREEQSFEAWLKGIAIYKLLDELRTAKVKNNLIETGVITESDMELTSNDNDENLILSLPEKERVIFILRDIEKYTYEEIADFIYDLNIEEIKSIVRQTRRGIISTDNYA